MNKFFAAKSTSILARTLATSLVPKPFVFHNPTKLVFGEGQLKMLPQLLPKDKTIVMTMGKGSVKSNGVYDQVKSFLKDYDVFEFEGIEANPDFNTLIKCVDIVKKVGPENTFLFPVGGGSVFDGTKFIAAASLYNHSDDLWEIVKTGGAFIEKTVPLGGVLTIPATGSEMNGGGVVSRRTTKEKYPMGHPSLFPVFSILDPNFTYSLPKRQVINGITDAFVHVCEQYLTTSRNAAIQDRFSESILKVLVTEGQKALEMNPINYTARYNYMYAATQALNKLINCGVDEDWATHMIGHELTAYLGLDHGQTLAIVLPRLLEYKIDEKVDQLAMMGQNVFGITGPSKKMKAKQCIAEIERFFNKIGQHTKISKYDCDQSKEWVNQLIAKFTKNNVVLGENKNIHPSDVEAILKKCF